MKVESSEGRGLDGGHEQHPSVRAETAESCERQHSLLGHRSERMWVPEGSSGRILLRVHMLLLR